MKISTSPPALSLTGQILLAGASDALERLLLLEMDALSRLRHPGIAAFLGACLEPGPGGRLFLIREPTPGGTLQVSGVRALMGRGSARA